MLKYTKILPIIALMFALTGCYDIHTTTNPTQDHTLPNISIAQLRTLSSRDKAVTHTDDIIIKGIVTSNDSDGNFYRTLFIEDDTAAAEIFVGFYDLCTVYPPGCKISLKLNGCASHIEDEILQIGLPNNSYAANYIDYFYTAAVADRYITRDNITNTVIATNLTIPQLNPGYCGRLIQLDNLRHTPHSDEVQGVAAGYHRYCDNAGNCVYLHVSEYADFAEIELPKQTLSIIGILYYSSVGYNVGKQFVIKPRTTDDILSY